MNSGMPPDRDFFLQISLSLRKRVRDFVSVCTSTFIVKRMIAISSIIAYYYYT